MINIWDIPTRLFHWTLVALFTFMIISGKSDDMMEWHFYAGYLLSGLIAFRFIWGFLGTRYARFSSFVLNPLTAITYTRELFSNKHKSYYGHTPAGSVMIILLLVLLVVQLITGMMSTDDIIWNGPLYNTVSSDTADAAGEIHEIIQNLLIGLTAFHILAIILYKVKFKEPLVPAMIHGKKPIIKQGNTKKGDQAREELSYIKLIIAIAPATGLTYWLFTLPI